MSWQSQKLSNAQVVLEPLSPTHFDALWAVAQHEQIWRYMPFSAASKEQFVGYLAHMLSEAKKGVAMPFATLSAVDEKVVGSTSFLAMDEANKRLEIGATWVTPEHQRSAINTHAKFLQLGYAFEVLGCNRVEFKTDSLNEKSQNAIRRIGAREEGTFRNHMVLSSGRIRHSVYFSITREEWPEVKERLSIAPKR